MAEVVRSSLAPGMGLRTHRSLDERLFVRWPAAWAAFARLSLRLPPRSRLRRALVRRSALSGFSAWSRGDLEVMLVRYAPDYQIEMPPEFVGVGIRSSYRGHAGLREWAADLDEAVTEKELTPVEVIDAGDRLVILAELHYRARSGVPLDTHWGQAVWFERGLMVRQLNFTDWDSTLRAAGIPMTAVAGDQPGATSVTRWAVEPLHRSRRGLYDRLLLAMPSLGRALIALAVRARGGSRLRRVLASYGLRVGLAQVERRDYQAISSFLDPEIELHMFPDAPDERVLDVEPVYRGHDGYARAGEIFQSDFDNFHWELRELYDPGGNRIGGRVGRSGRGGHSGITVRDADFYVWQLERGFLRRQWVLRTESAMLALLQGAELPHR